MTMSSATRRSAMLALLLPLAVGLVLTNGCGEQANSAQPAHDHDHSAEGGHGHDEHAEAGHEGHDEHDDHGHEENVLRLTEQALREFGIEVRLAEAGALSQTLELPGEVVFNPDRVAHVTPRVPGVVREVFKTVGDQVQAGEVLAVLDSRELAQAKSAYLGAVAGVELARANFEREQRLFEQQIAPEAEFLQARQALREAQIAVQLAERELHALGLTEQHVQALPEQPEEQMTRYELVAPIGGTIIERHLTRGEVVPAQPSEPPVVIADLATVWVQLTVYPRNLAQVRPGQRVRIAANKSAAAVTGTIDYVSPQVSEGTRTATARVVLDNAEGRWRPGQFITGQVQLGEGDGGGVIVPASALQTVEGETVVYVRTAEGFEPRPVEAAQRRSRRARAPGQRYAATNTFTLKAEQGRALLEHAGHAH